MTMVASVLCPVCAAPSSLMVRLRGDFSARRCRTCLLVFADPLPSDAELEQFYSQWMFSLPDEQHARLWRTHTQRGVDEIVTALNSSRSVPIRTALDFGGGLGFFAQALTAHVATVHLFDMSSASRDYASAEFAPAVTVDETPEQALAAGPYDLILLNQVIEHVPDPVQFLAPLVQALTPDGVLIVTTPNNRMWDLAHRLDLLRRYSGNASDGRFRGILALARDSWLCLDPPRHLYAFDERSLARLIGEAGGRSDRLFTRGWRDDPFDYPMYVASSGVVGNINAGVRRVGGALADALDLRRRHGNTLIAMISRDPAAQAHGRATGEALNIGVVAG